MVESRQRQTRSFHGELYAQVGLIGVLPLQVGIAECLRGIGVIGIVGTIVGGAAWGEGQHVAVRRGRVEHLERRQLDAFAVACMQLQVADGAFAAVAPEHVSGVGAGRQAADGAVIGTVDEREVVAQSGCQFKGREFRRRHNDLVFCIECQVVHGSLLVIAVFAPRRGTAHVTVVGSTAVVAAGSVVDACQQPVPERGLENRELRRVFRLQLGRPRQRLRVVEAQHVPRACRPQHDGGGQKFERGGIIVFGNVVALFGDVNVRLAGGTAGTGVVLALAVRI